MLYTSLVIGTNCIGSCKPNYHTNTTTALRPLLGKVSGFVKWCIRGALDGELSGYNTESLTVDHKWVTCLESSTLPAR
jgi:hypothetical protein